MGGILFICLLGLFVVWAILGGGWCLDLFIWVFLFIFEIKQVQPFYFTVKNNCFQHGYSSISD